MAVKKKTSIPKGAINPQTIFTDKAIAADFKVPLTPAQQNYQTKITAERMQAQADAYFKANPELKPPEPPKKNEPPVEPGPIEEPVIDPTVSTSGNISEFGTGAPTYTAPTQTPAEVATQAETTTAAALIMLNGIVQLPGTAYNMSPNPSTSLVFTEAPAEGDIIDIRFL
jgi:hypothetical protein